MTRSLSQSLPLVCCLMVTYNRAPGLLQLLEEAVESFWRQDYPSKELLILNDTPGQLLTCDLPGVKILNYPYRFPSLGEKLNAGIMASTAELFCRWDDDDISLPWRISQGVKELAISPIPGYWKPPQVWYLQKGGLPAWHHPVGVRHTAGIFSKQAWQRAGRYPHTWGEEDLLLDHALKGWQLPIFPQGLAVRYWAFCYRWGVSPCHLSSRGDMEQHYTHIGQRPVQQGTFPINPRWQEDYVALTRQHLPKAQEIDVAQEART